MPLRIHTRSLARTTVHVRGIADSTQVVEPSAPPMGELPERGGEITGNTWCRSCAHHLLEHMFEPRVQPRSLLAGPPQRRSRLGWLRSTLMPMSVHRCSLHLLTPTEGQQIRSTTSVSRPNLAPDRSSVSSSPSTRPDPPIDLSPRRCCEISEARSSRIRPAVPWPSPSARESNTPLGPSLQLARSSRAPADVQPASFTRPIYRLGDPLMPQMCTTWSRGRARTVRDPRASCSDSSAPFLARSATCSTGIACPTPIAAVTARSIRRPRRSPTPRSPTSSCRTLRFPSWSREVHRCLSCRHRGGFRWYCRLWLTAVLGRCSCSQPLTVRLSTFATLLPRSAVFLVASYRSDRCRSARRAGDSTATVESWRSKHQPES